MTKHLCIKKEDGLYLVQPTMEYPLKNEKAWSKHQGEAIDIWEDLLQSLPAIKCTDGFIEGKEYSESEFKLGYECYGRHTGISGAILLPALKEDRGEEEQQLFTLKELKYAIDKAFEYGVQLVETDGNSTDKAKAEKYIIKSLTKKEAK